jgi:hypothetical protein
MRALLRLAITELKLFVREPMVLTFVFALPVLTVVILGGVFDDDDPNFEGALPSDYYIAAYIGVVIAAIGLVMLPGTWRPTANGACCAASMSVDTRAGRSPRPGPSWPWS